MAPGFVPPHLSLEFLAKAGMFHHQLPNLAGKRFNNLEKCYSITFWTSYNGHFNANADPKNKTKKNWWFFSVSTRLNMSYDTCTDCIWAHETTYQIRPKKTLRFFLYWTQTRSGFRYNFGFHQSNIYSHFTDLFIAAEFIRGIYQRLDKYLTGIYNHFQIK